MNRAPALKRLFRLVHHWFSKPALALALLVSGAAIAPCAAQTVVLQEPDFTGMFTIDETGPAPVLHDATRGWTYFGGGNVEGVAFSQSLFRINDFGLPDTQWRLPSGFQITERYLAPDGTPIVQAYVAPGTSNFEKRWYRLNRESIGLITPVEISSVADMPPRDSIDLTQNTGLEPRLLPQRDGTIVVFETVVAPEPLYATTYTLRKRDRSGRELWSQVLGGGRPHNLNSDAAGNVYVLGEAVTIGGKTANLIRIRADGSVDTAWAPAADVASNVGSVVRVVTDRIVIADYIGGAPSVNRLTTFDLVSGRKLVERYPPYRIGAIADDGTALSGHANGHWASLDTTRNDDSGDRVSIARVGGGGSIQASAPWRDGYVLGGNFLYWFDGKLYRNLMRVDAAFRPDPSWMPDIEYAVAALAVDRDGRLLVVSNSASGTQARIQRFNANGALDNSWQPVFKGDVYKLLPASDGMLFVGGAYSAVNDVPRNSLARFRADGTLDPEWASQPTWPVMQPGFAGWGRDGVFGLLDAGGDGVYFTWQDAYMNGAVGGVIWLAREGLGAAQTLNRGVADGGLPLRDPVTGALYAIADAWGLSSGSQRGTVLVRMTPPAFAVDSAWTTYAGEYGRQFGGFAYQTDSHVYVCRGQNVWLGMQLRRFDKISGKEDPNWSSEETFLCGADAVERRADGSTLVFSPVLYGQFYGTLMRFSTSARNTPKTVVEYYSRNARRFFITGRANEIAQLDAMPTNFVRTGMTFAAETALVRTFDVATMPICRFYAAPEAGGSNTHFYGRDADCTLLKRFPSLRYEGFDFRAGVATNGTCPAALPIPVFRLFNNASASNNGNHRYVVSESGRAEMLAAGWLDEGVAFCTSSAINSRPLADVIR
jgi:hypothetical protein